MEIVPFVWLMSNCLLYSVIIKNTNMKELKGILKEKGFNLVMVKPYNKEWKRVYVGGGNLYKKAMKVAKNAGYKVGLYVNANMDSFLVKEI